MPEALIALGGNVGDVRTTLRKAIEIFCDGEEVWLRKRSSDYKTPPWGVTDQPPFINAAITVGTGLEPRVLLERAHAVERIFGRNRETEERWGPRTLDIDLIAYNDLVDERARSDPAASALVRARFRTCAACRDRAGPGDHGHTHCRCRAAHR